METNKSAGVIESIRKGVMSGDKSTMHKGMRAGKGKAPNPTVAVTLNLPAKTVGKHN